ncbi:SEC10/PgrA surface exclusion domain-containing protein [Limosilactobacillus agrestis]|uniref:SEC10/PgrA surface exclusion domain-containing protein n=1 Tax=Limosilactobacillus agrestis TaxID=2759748 RepID=UPI001E35BF0A|nr:SEC10/PgrA surface exclusion domain-containing protein [Limosilactobacillus agrestis]MCD7111947.1 SEC10/PgrA surface exclusion domain-containing protein [Limosilactobacillus agrestis]
MNSKKKVLTGAIVAATFATTAVSVNDNRVHADDVTDVNESSITPITQAQQIVNEKESTVNSTQDSVKDAQNKVDQANSAKKVAQDNYNQANNTVQSQQQVVETAKQQLNQDQESAQQAQKAVSSAQNKVDEIKSNQAKKDQLEKEANQAKKDFTTIKNENKDNQLNNSLTNAQKGLTNAKAKQKDAQSNLGNAENNADKISNDLINVQKEGSKPATQAEVDAAKNKVNEAQSAKDNADKDVAIAEDAVNKTQKEVDTKKAALDNLSADWATRNLIDAPNGYKEQFFGKRGMVPYLRQVRSIKYNPDSGVTFMPEKYAGDRPSLKQLKEFANSFKNSSANDGTQDLVFMYAKGNKVIVTDNVDNVPLDTDQPVTIWYRNLSDEVDNVSKVMQTPTEVYYEYYSDDQEGEIDVKSWNDLPENKKAEAIVKYLNNYNYTPLNPSENVAISDAVHLDPTIQQKLTEYAVNVMNHFNEMAGYPGRVVANNVAIQKANYVAEHQQSPNNHDQYASQIGADGEDMVLDLVDPSNTDLDQLRAGIYNGIGDMLFPDSNGGDWLHATQMLRAGELYPGTGKQPAKFGLSFDKFGNLHLLWFPASDADFKDSTDYIVKETDNTNEVQKELDNANKAFETAQANLKQSKDGQATAIKNLTVAQQELTAVQQGTKITELQKAKDKADQQLAQAQQQADKANAEVAAAQQSLADAQSKLATWTNKYQVAEQKVTDAQKALDQINDPSVLTTAQQTLADAQEKFDYANKLVNDDTAKLNQAQQTLNALQATAEDAKTKLDNANSAVMSAQNSLKTANDNLLTAQSELQRAKDHLAMIQKIHENDSTPDKEDSATSTPASTITLHNGAQSAPTQHLELTHDENEKVVSDSKVLGQNTGRQFESSVVNHDNENRASATSTKQLPQTGSVDSSSLFALGIATLAGMFGLGFRKRNF